MKNDSPTKGHNKVNEHEQPMLKDLVHGLAAIEGVQVVRVGKLRNIDSFDQTKLRVVK